MHAAAAIANGKADFVALGRSLIADPDWVEKAAGAASRRGVVSPATPVSTTCAAARAALRRQRCSRTGDPIRAVDAADRRTHRDDRCRSGGPDLRLAGGGQQRGHDLRARRVAPVARFAMPARRRCFRRSSPTRIRSIAMSRNSSPPASARAWCFATASTSRAPRQLLAPFDRIVIATGAEYRFGPWTDSFPAARRGLGRCAGSASHLRHAGISATGSTAAPVRHRRRAAASRADWTEADGDRRCRQRRARACRRSTAPSRRRSCRVDNNVSAIEFQWPKVTIWTQGFLCYWHAKWTADRGPMTDFKRWLIMAPVVAGFMAATVCAASAQDRQPGFLDNLFGGSERLAPSAEPAQGQYQGQGQGQGQRRDRNAATN